MARFSDTNVSLRLNRIPVGAVVDLHNFDKRGVILASGAKFIGWRNGDGEIVEAPKVIKSMPQDNTMDFEITGEDGVVSHLTLVKDPKGFGSMFLKVTTGEGDSKKEVLNRITAYASEELVNSTRVTRAKKTETAEEPATSGVVVETTEAE